MGPKKQIYLLTAACIQFLLVMFVLPLFSFPGYSVIKNTVCDLGAQSSPHAWVMNLAFICLAICCVIAGWSYFEGFVLHRVVLLILGISLVLIAFFNQAPCTEVRYNIQEAGLHSYFAFTGVISYVMLTLATSFVVDTHHERLLAITTGLSAIILSVLTTESDQQAGIWQRLLFIISFGWMIYNFKTHEF